MAVDLSGGNRFSVQQYRSMEEHAMDLFYHPQGRLGDFPDGFPVYHVEMLTLLIGGDSEVERKLCAECRNVWVYQPQSGRLLIYENQPGDFFDLRRALEQGVGGGGTGETSWHGTGTGGAGETSWHGAGTGGRRQTPLHGAGARWLGSDAAARYRCRICVCTEYGKEPVGHFVEEHPGGICDHRSRCCQCYNISCA